MRTSDFDYDLPPEYIAQTPAEPRDSSRLMVLHRATGQIEHAIFRDIGRYLCPGDLLVLNQTRVIPARLFARKPTGGRVELLLLRKRNDLTWEALVGGKGLLAGKKLILESDDSNGFVQDSDDSSRRRLTEYPKSGDFGFQTGIQKSGNWSFKTEPPGFRAKTPNLQAEIIEVLEGSRRLIRFAEPIEPYFPRIGHVPLPPYIHTPLADPERYQTVYAREPGSAAAPTAGLHFTPRLLDELQAQGVRLGWVTLHVGLDTFAPVTEDDPSQHKIHTEWCHLPPETADLINQTRAQGGRVIAVGTTSVRTLESVASLNTEHRPQITAFTGPTSLYILPGYQFKVVDAMITNFHLPRSTLIMLVSAFAGRETILHAYKVAKQEGYRFYSFGDAMLIV